jgi:hypothetical protein
MTYKFYATDDDLVLRFNPETYGIEILQAQSGNWVPRPNTNLHLCDSLTEDEAQQLAGKHSLTAAAKTPVAQR